MSFVGVQQRTGRIGGDAWDLARVFPLLCLTLVLVLRCRFGLDVTDEMQYQGQILGLVESGRLFSTDLFIQQLVYLLFWPLYEAHHLLWGDTGLVLFGRGMLALLLIALHATVRRGLLDAGASRWQAGLAAFATTFAVPFHGIFALSYNTVSQCAWVVFLLWYLDPWRVPPWRWVTLLAVAGLAHPVAALAMSLLLSGALLRHWRRINLTAWGASLLAALALVAAALWRFTSLTDLQDALVFSGGFGVGGQALWAHAPSWQTVLAHAAAMLLLALAPGAWLRRRPVVGLTALALCGIMIWAGRLLVRGHWSYGYTIEISQVAALMAVGALLLARAGTASDAERAGAVRRLIVVALVHFLVLVGTSSNGLAQGVGALMLTIPIALALVTIRPVAPRGLHPAAALVPLGLALLLGVIHWSVAPYRDEPWFRPGRGSIDVPAFRHLSVSGANLALLQAYRRELGPELLGRQALIASERPGLYLALGAHPQTCMLYMHSSGDASSTAVLTRCLQSRRPEVVLDVLGPDPDQGASPLRKIVKQLALDRAMICTTGSLDERWIHAPSDAPPVHYRVCKAP